MAKKHKYTNRLFNEKSPYLLQHAHNPVDWHPWADEAFAKAAAENKLIFLSIGYATCHWCHIMEEESFSREETAKLLNETFVNIKVDREERPDIDSLYMEFAKSLMAGAAGWPLNVILTPDLKPVFAATYLPPTTSQGLLGLHELVERIQTVWQGEERERLLMQADQIVDVLSSSQHTSGNEMPPYSCVDTGALLLYKMADPIYGGLKGAPKFPLGYQTNFMLRYAFRKKDSRSLFFVERSLEMMHRGGIYDHVGGGFSRYSTDEKWQIPHFEKMLYDNALLAHCYMEIWKITKRWLYREVSEEILHYILREMTCSKGGFYSAQDADTEGVEGLYYTWTLAQIEEALEDDAQLFCQLYGVTAEGNFEGRSVLHLTDSLENFSVNIGKSLDELKEWDRQQKQKLFLIREQREHPLTDDKILSSWNGLMIYSLIECGIAFRNEEFIQAAVKGAEFIFNHLWIEGRLFRRYRDGDAAFAAGLDEYAFMIRAHLSLFEAGEGSKWLFMAMQLAGILEEEFKSEEGAFYQTNGLDPSILLRKCQFSDGAEPSGNAVHAENLLRLWLITLNPSYLKQAEDILKAVAPYLEQYAPGYCYHLISLCRYYDQQTPTLVFALNDTRCGEAEIAEVLYQNFIPHKSVVWLAPDDKNLFETIPFLNELSPIDDQTTLYICKEGACQPPIHDLNEMIEAIKKL